jgi:undecaprenyl-diphosphatase
MSLLSSSSQFADLCALFGGNARCPCVILTGLNDYLLSVILGVVEGITEFLPVSSSAHLRICEALFGIDLGDGYWKMFTIVIQLGAILVLPIFFWNRIIRFLTTFPRGSQGDRTALTHPVTLVIIAFLCTAAPTYLLTKVVGKNLENLVLMGSALIVGGLVMWAVDAIYGGYRRGIAAVVPGTSRSMITISSGQVAGLSRTAALEFSFLLSIPTMAAATGYDLLRSLKPHHGEANAVGATHIDPHGWVLLAIGFVVSFIVAFGVVAWFMNWVRTRGFTPFAIYRIVAGAGVVVWALRLAH